MSDRENQDSVAVEKESSLQPRKAKTRKRVSMADPVDEEVYEYEEKEEQGSEADADVSEAAKTDNALSPRNQRGRKRRASYYEDSDSDEEVFFNIAEKKKKRGRPKGNTLDTGTWVAKKPLGRPKRHTLNQSLRRGQKHPTELICELGQVFYNLGWVSGTGGGISIKTGDQIYVAPSGVQKERLQAEDIFVLSPDGQEIVIPPVQKNLKKSQCTPLFMLAYKKSATAKTGIKCGSEDRQMRYDEELIVPIIENTPFEADLADSMSQALELYPDTHAVLVRRHGVYIWGETWEKAKTMAETYDYLFDIAVQMKNMGVEPTKPPEDASKGQVHMNGK
ncbi:probable methylthioribulose-1-phosphate dehydratase isoform X2 [Palaemon carinicauda]|uniref:probable methylthioribulose-1-phosphate dehydratase isoform X2 n=1 Tax=Palaemon carinicauda TaxID=392227 RepID=UPI0035B63361